MIRNRCWLLALAACASALGAQAHPASSSRPADARANQLSDAERAAGWRLLFDGRTLAGWRGLGYDSVPTAHWQVDAGTIKKIASGNVSKLADGQPLNGGDLMTVDTFGDFELTWEWKVTPGANSGLKYNVSEELSVKAAPNHAALGFEYQILDDDRHVDGKLATHREVPVAPLVRRAAPRAPDTPGPRRRGVLPQYQGA